MKINNYEVVIAFEIDETIVLSLGPSLKAIQKNLGGELIPINAPEDAPPPLPRIILKLSDSLLKLAIDRISISINPPSHVKSNVNKSSKFALQRSVSIIKDLLALIPPYKWCGIITDLEFPSDPNSYNIALKAVTPIFDKLINIDRSDKELATFQLQYGFKEDSHFINYTISGYENRNIKLIGNKKKGFVNIPIDDQIVTECGVKIILDINNKPGGAIEDPVKDIEYILGKINKLSATLPDDLNLKGILI